MIDRIEVRREGADIVYRLRTTSTYEAMEINDRYLRACAAAPPDAPAIIHIANVRVAMMGEEEKV